jgi:Ca2+-binding RTX toxin-like protein
LAFTTVTGSNGVTSLVGTSGIDVATIVTLSSNVFVGGQGANDSVDIDLAGPTYSASNYTVNGGAGDDTINFNFSPVLNSVINGDGGTGTAGNDTIAFGRNVINSAVNGGSGNDVIRGFGVNDFANYSNSTVNGNAGDDTIRVGASSATSIYGGQDTDNIRAEGNSSAVLINGNKGADTIILGIGAFTSGTLYGGNGNDTISALDVTVATTAAGVFISGDLGDDTIAGSNGIDTINGVDGADSINGGTGADVIDGGAGNDTIIGGAGADAIAAGVGNNLLVYTILTDSTLTSSTSNTGFDTISGFAASTTSAPNGDRFGVATLPTGFINKTGQDSVVADANLGNTLFLNLNNLGANNVALITITGAASFAGNYVVIDSGTGNGFNYLTDAVIKVNNLANIGANTFTQFPV